MAPEFWQKRQVVVAAAAAAAVAAAAATVIVAVALADIWEFPKIGDLNIVP